MRASTDAPAWLFKQEADKPAHPVAPDVMSEPEPTRGCRLVCAKCGQGITTEASRIAVAGRHEHTFANPHGYVYRIGCFAPAVGLTLAGPISGEFSWFVGYSWQIEQCAVCSTHLGWLFRTSDRVFHGLILDALMEAMDEA